MAFVAKFPNPIEVSTPNRGIVTLRWVTIESLSKLDKLAEQCGSTDEFVIRALHQQLLSPTPSLKEFRTWPTEDRNAIAAAWAAHSLGLNRPIDTTNLTASFLAAYQAYSKETLERVSATIRTGLDLLGRQERQIAELGSAALRAQLETFRVAELSWQKSLSQAAQLFTRRLAIEETIRQRTFIETTIQWRTGLLSDMASAMVANERLVGVSSLMGTLAEGFRASAEHQAALASLADVGASLRPAVLALSQRVDSLAQAARAVWVDWERQAVPPTTLWLQEAPGIEVFSASRTAAAVVGSPTKDDPVSAVQRLEIAALRVEPLLVRVHPDLITMYKGATSAISRGGPDAARHLAVSLRELLTHVIHRLAPDEQLKKWDGATAGDFPNGRPTRRVRLRYIFRALQGTSYHEFVVEDVNGALELMDMLNGDTHRLTGQLATDGQRMVLRRTEGVLAMLLEAAYGES